MISKEEESVGKRIIVFLTTLSMLITVAGVANAGDSQDLDNQRWRVSGDWWFSHPSGYFGLQGSNNYVNFNKDFGFGSYSTFTGRVDYRFRRKHHLLFGITPVNNTKTVTLNRTIEFQGNTYNIGTTATATLKSLNFSPGYQYDIIRTNHGYLAIVASLNLLDSEATIKGTASVNGNGVAASSSKSFFAPLPAFGPAGRWYPLHDSRRLALEGAFTGMSFFGYGNFLSGRANVDIGLTQHLMLRGGYQMGSRLSVHGTNDQIAVQLTQKGPTAGIEYSWGEVPPPEPKAASTQPSDWHVDWVPLYLWFSGLHGNVGAKGYSVPVDASFSQIFDQLNIGLMSLLDVRRKKFGLLTDLVFMSLSTDQKDTPVGAVYTGFTANSKTFWIAPEAYYRLLEKERGTVDVLAGVRVWKLDNSIDLFQGSATSITAGQSQSWADPILGARFRLNLKKGLFAKLGGDAGGFGAGSQSTWQIYTGVGKTFKEKYSVELGYRYLSVDYVNGGFLFDTHMSGLITGLGIHFK